MHAGRKDVKLVGVKVAGKALQPSDYDLTDKLLTLSKLPQGEFELEIDVDIKPQARSWAQPRLYRHQQHVSMFCLAEIAAEHSQGR